MSMSGRCCGASRRDVRALLVDAPALVGGGFSLSGSRLVTSSGTVEFGGLAGWLRRYSPSLWGAGTVAGTLEAVTHRAFLGLVASISRIGSTRWLTSVDAMLRGEDRLLQLEVAAATGARVPATLVTSDSDEAAEVLGESFVVKPLLGGYFDSADGPQAVYTAELSPDELGRVDFGAAPFVAQERIDAVEHHRVVTVGEAVWTARLSADGRPLDWRQQERAHFEWEVAADPDTATAAGALALAAAMDLGYSSQDWVIDENGPVFLDLNPGGQWLFLPEAIASEVSGSIAEHLSS